MAAKRVNNRSVIVLEIGKVVPLFPGDAQGGTWEAAMNDEEWQPLLRKVTFYKVGHHGSDNAIPKTFVKRYLDEKFLALVSTLGTTSRTRPSSPETPFERGKESHMRRDPLRRTL